MLFRVSPSHDRIFLGLLFGVLGFLANNHELKGYGCILDKTLQSNQWYHIAGSYRASTGRSRLYINGALANETKVATTLRRSAVPGANNSAQAQWKCANLGASNTEKPLQGILDEFRIFRCELLPDEIMDLYSKNSVKKYRIPDPKHLLNWNSMKQKALDLGLSER